MAGKKAAGPPKANLEAIAAGAAILHGHSLFSRLAYSWRQAEPRMAADGYARVLLGGRDWQGNPLYVIQTNPWRRAMPEEWASVMAQALLHAYLNHGEIERPDDAQRAAGELLAMDFLRQVGVGRRPFDLPYIDAPLPGRDLRGIAEALRDNRPELKVLRDVVGVAGVGQAGWVHAKGVSSTVGTRKANDELLAAAIRGSIVDAIERAGGAARTGARNPNSMAERARSWFVSSYPLLASLAAAFDIVEDAGLCEQFDIAIAAVDSEMRSVYINPRFPWTLPKMKFVIAHELLHVGLRHEERRQGRDAYLWNVACDYVINGWLMQMGVGEMPTDALLLDPELKFEQDSSEAIYDRIVGDMRLIRRFNKSRTLRGQGKVDVLGERPQAWWHGPGTDLDAFYRRALAEGLDLHLRGAGRGLLPGDLVEEIRAIQQKPISWDVKLAQWMDAFFPPIEAKRSFARASRRQSSTPDIPRAVWMRPEERQAARTFGVVLDTSGSMPSRLLARALGAIASYAMSRDVAQVRVMQCDAGVHDMGYVEPERLLHTVEVKGRGGTVLQPAIKRLQDDDRFPKDAPILIITDGGCDVLSVGREHAFLMPEGARLPFRTMAEQFRFDSGD